MHEEQLYHKKKKKPEFLAICFFFFEYFLFCLPPQWLITYLSYPLASNKAPIICFCLEAQNNVCGVINHVLF